MTCLKGERCSPVQQQKALAAGELLSFPSGHKHAQTGDFQYPKGSLGMDLFGILQELSLLPKVGFSAAVHLSAQCTMCFRNARDGWGQK